MSDERKPVYVFKIKSPNGKEAWPVVYTSEELALAAPHRCSAIVEVHVPEPGDFTQIVCNVIEFG